MPIRISSSSNLEITYLHLLLDLHALVRRRIENSFFLNVGKCKVITFTRKKNPSTAIYHTQKKQLVRIRGFLMERKLDCSQRISPGKSEF